jgi:AraC-like DNA-binding protein
MIPVATFDTRMVAPHERIDFWEERCAENVVGLRCSCLSDSGLEARYQYFDLGRIKMIDIAGAEHFVERTPHLLRRREKDSAFLTVILSGKVFVNRGGKCIVAETGDVVLYDTNQAYMHGFPAQARQVIFELSGEDFRARFADWKLSETAYFSGAMNPSCMVPLAVREVLRLTQSPGRNALDAAGSMEERIWGVMETAYALVNGGAQSAYHIQILFRVRKHIAERLGDPDLSVASVAAATGISVRQLNRLFEGQPLSITAHIQAKRLEGARRDLVGRSGRGVTISDICYKWGFKSLAHFSRKFREAFGVSPSQCQ